MDLQNIRETIEHFLLTKRHLTWQSGYTKFQKTFPPEEKFGLTIQIRNSSRSVCVNVVEAYKRRRYKNHYVSRINDSETENAETQVWPDFSLACKYFTSNDYLELKSENDEVAKLILYMINNPDKSLKS